jgi:hypothetical protein
MAAYGGVICHKSNFMQLPKEHRGGTISERLYMHVPKWIVSFLRLSFPVGQAR